MMNAINPNDLLAKRVIDIAKYNRTGDAFIKGPSIAKRPTSS
jgi:pre-mRNA-splicing factor ATP-dependent RNA helicase DHX38/PRP16